MKNKFLTILLLSFLLAMGKVSVAQTGDNQVFVSNRLINADVVVREFSKFRYKDIFSDTVLVTILGKRNKSKDLSRDELKKWMYKNYFNKDYEFALSAVVNDGYVIIISQYSKKDEIPVRFFSLFISQATEKIVVMEIEENK